MRQAHINTVRSQHLQPTCPAVAPSSHRHRQRWQQQQQQQQRSCAHTQAGYAAALHPLQLIQQQRASLLIAAAGSSPDKPSRQQQQQQQPQVDPAAAADADEDEWDSDDEEGGEFEYADDEDEGEWDEDEDWEDEEGEEEEEAAVSTARQIPEKQATVDFTQDDFVEVGLISRPHGVRGEVKVQLITDEPRKRLGAPGKRLWLQALPVRSGLVPPSVAAARQGGAAAADPFKTLRRVVVQSGRVARPGGKGQREEWAVKFEGYDSREKAADLAGHKLLLALCDREARPRGRDEFFIDQLVGCKAVDAADSSRLVGIVTEVYENGASYSLLRVRLAPEEADIADSKYRSVLVPFVSEIVPTVDLAGGQLGLALPEGLLETASTTKLRKPYTPAQQAQLREQLKKRQQQQ